MAKRAAEKSAKGAKKPKQLVKSSKKQPRKRVGRQRQAVTEENVSDNDNPDGDEVGSDGDGLNAEGQDADKDKSDGDDQDIGDQDADEHDSSNGTGHLVALTKGNSCARCLRLGIDCLLPAPQPGFVTQLHAERHSCHECASRPARPSCNWPSLLRDSASYLEMKGGIAELAEMIEDLSEDEDSPEVNRLKQEIKLCVEAERRFDEYTQPIRLRWGLNTVKEVSDSDLKDLLKREGIL